MINELSNYTKINTTSTSIFDNKKIIMFVVLIIIILIFVSSMSISFSTNNKNKTDNIKKSDINLQTRKNKLNSMLNNNNNNHNGMIYKTKIKSITPSLNSQINDKENQYYY